MADAAAEAVTSDSGLLDWLTGGSTTSSIALLLCVLFGAYAAYIITNEPQRDGTHAPAQEDDDEEPPRDFTPKQLREFDGKDEDTPLYVAVKGDVFDPKSVKKALNLVEEYDAVVSTVGGTPADPKADSEGNIALIDACVAKGIKKFVLVTSIGTGDSKSAPPQNVYDALEPVLIEKEKAEEHLKKIAKEKGIDFVIVRPGGLKSEPRTNTAVLTENTNVCGAIHREDVAALTMMCVLKDKANGKTLSAVDKAQLFDQPEFEVFNVGDGPLSPTQEATENALK